MNKISVKKTNIEDIEESKNDDNLLEYDDIK